MASIYKNVKDLAELLVIVKRKGLSTEQEDICRVQDIFGHATEEEMVALANDKGRGNSEEGWYCGRDGLSSTFYFVLFKIWCWEEAVRFYNEHSNRPLIEKMKEMETIKNELESVRQKVLELISNESKAKELFFAERERADRAEKEAIIAIQDLDIAKGEIRKLKAKLYDLLVE